MAIVPGSGLLGQQWANASRQSPGYGPANLPTAAPEGNPSIPHWRCGGLRDDCSPGREGSTGVGKTRRRLRGNSFTAASWTVISHERCWMFLRVYLLDVRNGAREGSNANSFMHSRIAKVGLSGNWHPGRCPRRPPGQEAPFGTPGLDGSPRACRSGPAPRAVRCAVWPLPGGLEAAAEGVRDEVEGAPAAAVVVEEAAAGDAEDGAGEFPTGRVAGVGR